MKILLNSLSVLAIASFAVAQTNFVQNPDFETKKMAPWSDNPTSVHKPAIASFDVTGKGASYAYGCTPDKSKLLLTQKVIVAKGRRYHFKMDVASLWPALYGNTQADAGRFIVTLANQTLHTLNLGRVYKSSPLLRRSVSVAFVAASSGKLALTIAIYRTFAGLKGRTPRCYVDNVSLTFDTRPSISRYGVGCAYTFSPTVNITSKPYTLTQTVYSGVGQSVGIMLLGTKQINVQIPGTKNCRLFTNPLIALPYTMDSQGLWSTTFNLPARIKAPINIQHAVFTYAKSWTLSTTDAYVIQ